MTTGGPTLRPRDPVSIYEDEAGALLAERDGYLDALEVASDLLREEGYDTDLDYRQEWATISAALGVENSQAKADDAA